MYLSFLISSCLITSTLSVDNPADIGDLPLCWAERLALEGILARCHLHHTNVFLHCNFCVIENGLMVDETSGRLSYNRTSSPETCEFVYFPTRTGTYRFEVGITGNYTLSTNDVIISELPELRLQQACVDVSRVLCIGRWFRETPFIKMSYDDIEINEMSIKRYTVVGRNHIYFSVAKVQLSHLSPTKVTCHAMYTVRSFTKNISQDFILRKFSTKPARHVSFISNSGEYLHDSISLTSGLVLKCSSGRQPMNLSLSCGNAQGDFMSTYGESPILFNISESGNSMDIRCKCRSHPINGCYNEKDLLITYADPTGKWRGTVPIFKNKDGSIVSKLYEMAEGTNSSIECVPVTIHVLVYNVTVTCWSHEGLLLLNISQNSHPVKFLITGDTSFNRSSCMCHISFSNLSSPISIINVWVNSERSGDFLSSEIPTPNPQSRYDAYSPAYYILTGVITFFFFPFIVATIVYVYLYWKEMQHVYVDNSHSGPTHSNDYESIRHSPQSSNATSIPAENCALLAERSSPYDSLWNSDSGGSSRSNPYFTDTPPDLENRSSESSSS